MSSDPNGRRSSITGVIGRVGNTLFPPGPFGAARAAAVVGVAMSTVLYFSRAEILASVEKIYANQVPPAVLEATVRQGLAPLVESQAELRLRMERTEARIAEQERWVQETRDQLRTISADVKGARSDIDRATGRIDTLLERLRP